MNVWAFRRLVRENRALMLENNRCPLGAAVGAGYYETTPACTWVSGHLGLTLDYCFGVAMGFDGERGDNGWPVSCAVGARFGRRMRIVAGITEDGGES